MTAASVSSLGVHFQDVTRLAALGYFRDPGAPSVGLYQLKFDDTGCAGHWNNDAW